MFVDKMFYAPITAELKKSKDGCIPSIPRTRQVVSRIDAREDRVFLADFDKGFATIHFDFFLDEKKIDIYNSALFNPFVSVTSEMIDSLIKYID